LIVHTNYTFQRTALFEMPRTIGMRAFCDKRTSFGMTHVRPTFTSNTALSALT
jgi:hypothetical protein